MAVLTVAVNLGLGVWGQARWLGTTGVLLEAALRVVAAGDGVKRSVAPASRAALRGLCFPPGHVVATSTPMRHLYQQLRHIAGGTIPVLLTGETGVGKEHVARIVHLSSGRAERPFEAVNCAAIPAELLEAELFGIEKGVATGVDARVGKLVHADGGTVLLDEIGDMPPALQAKLLRALQEREVHPVGARRPRAVDVRLVAATNADPATLVSEGRLRKDLYYRLAGCTLRIPPLRERPADVAGLVEHFLDRAVAETGKAVAGMTVKVLHALEQAPWPGNVRQLESEVRRLVHLCPDGDAVDSSLLGSDLVAFITASAAPHPRDGDLELRPQLEQLERRLVSEALARTGGNQVHAGRLLGVSRTGLAMKLRRLGIGGSGEA